MATALSFTKTSGGHWEASFTSSGDRIAVEVNRASAGTLLVLGCIEGLEKTTLQNFGPGADQDLIFEIDVPADVKIFLVSYSEVSAAKIVGA